MGGATEKECGALVADTHRLGYRFTAADLVPFSSEEGPILRGLGEQREGFGRPMTSRRPKTQGADTCTTVAAHASRIKVRQRASMPPGDGGMVSCTQRLQICQQFKESGPNTYIKFCKFGSLQSTRDNSPCTLHFRMIAFVLGILQVHIVPCWPTCQ